MATDAPSSATVLVVDDNEGILRLIQKALQHEGFSTVTAGSGKEAITWLLRHRADLMLLDLKLPDIEGGALVDHLAEIHRAVPFIIITGQGDERVAVDMMKRGALDYLVKDVDFLQFVPEVVRRAFARIEQQKQLTAAQEAVRESEERYRTVVVMSPDAIFVLKHGRIAFINPVGLRLLGAESAGQVLGKSPFDFFRRNRHEVIQQRIDRLSQGESASPLIDEELVRLDGSTRWVTLSSAMFTQEGETAVQFILRDITERKFLENEILEISDREQQRIGHDLHDGLGQQLTALEMKCFLLLEDLAANDLTARREQIQEQARQMSQALRECITTTRSLARGLAPVVLKADGLMGALEQLAHGSSVPGKIECRFVCRAPVMLDNSQTAKHLYRIAQEAVNNALKHARTRRITIHLAHDHGTLRLQIKDDGRGLPRSKQSKSGMGLEVMHHRALVIGASLEIDSKPGQGVNVTCTLPLENS